jgi:glutaredoxin
MKKIIFVLIVVAVIFGLYKLLFASPKSVTPKTEKIISADPDVIFYWGNNCPHCETVREFITKNDLSQKINITQKEVYENEDNQKELVAIVNQYCPDLNNGGIGVPLAFDNQNKQCILGDTPIINFLSEKTK